MSAVKYLKETTLNILTAQQLAGLRYLCENRISSYHSSTSMKVVLLQYLLRKQVQITED